MDDGIADTPRTGNQKSIKSSDGDAYRGPKGGDVDAYENPTELFQWINYGNYQSAAAHALEHPSEAKTWIVSRKRGKNGEHTVKWRYLPLHLACMKSNPSEDLLRALIYANPSAARERDYDGNLPIHYLLSEGCDHNQIIEMLLRANPESIDKRDRKGRNLLRDSV
jgi:ankyrin repeat protein